MFNIFVSDDLYLLNMSMFLQNLLELQMNYLLLLKRKTAHPSITVELT